MMSWTLAEIAYESEAFFARQKSISVGKKEIRIIKKCAGKKVLLNR